MDNLNQIKSGAILSYLGLIITIVIALLYTPVMIRLLGQSEFGLYALFVSFAAYFSVMDMGLGNAVIRYTAKNRTIGNKEDESKLNGMFLVLFSIVGLLVVVVGSVFFYKIEDMFSNSLTALEMEKAKIIMIILIANFALTFPLSVFSSIMQAYEKFIIIKIVAIIRSVLTPIVTLPILFLGFGSVAMMIIIAVVNIAILLFNAYYSLKYLKTRFYFGKLDKSLLKEILGYSFFVFLGVIVDQIYWNTDQFILGVMTGTVPVAVYAIAIQFIMLYMRFSTSISGMFLPKVTIMVANKESNEKLTHMMIRFGRLQFVILALILSGFILFGQTFINIWAGIDYSTSYYIVLIIMIPLSIPLIQNIGISILYAKNLQKFRSINLIFIAVFNIIITIPLVQNFEGVGAAVATAISLTIGNIFIMNIYYHLKLGINIPLFWRNISLMSIPVLMSVALGTGMNLLFPQESIMFLLSKITIFIILFSVLMWFFGFNKYEKDIFSSVFAKARMIFLKVFRKVLPN